jgi:Tfp pilus assembly protein PilZ
VVLRFRLPGREAPIKVLGKVVWRNADPNTRGGRGMGIQFLDLTPADRELIERNLAEAIATELSRAQERRERA